jgi:hypothetical protein
MAEYVSFGEIMLRLNLQGAFEECGGFPDRIATSDCIVPTP